MIGVSIIGVSIIGVLAAVASCRGGEPSPQGTLARTSVAPASSTFAVADTPCGAPERCDACSLGFAERRCLFPAPNPSSLPAAERSLYLAEAVAFLRQNQVKIERVTEGGTKFVTKDADKAEACLACVFGAGTVKTEKPGREPAAVKMLDASNVGDRFRTNDGLLKLPEVWTTLVNEFPTICEHQLVAQTIVNTEPRKGSTHMFEIPSTRPGLVFRGQIVIGLRAVGAPAPGPLSAEMSVEGRFGWRRQSESTWHDLVATELMDPRANKSADDALGKCVTGLAGKLRP